HSAPGRSHLLLHRPVQIPRALSELEVDSLARWNHRRNRRRNATARAGASGNVGLASDSEAPARCRTVSIKQQSLAATACGALRAPGSTRQAGRLSSADVSYS